VLLSSFFRVNVLVGVQLFVFVSFVRFEGILFVVGDIL
jgi:hypothetical protein